MCVIEIMWFILLITIKRSRLFHVNLLKPYYESLPAMPIDFVSVGQAGEDESHEMEDVEPLHVHCRNSEVLEILNEQRTVSGCHWSRHTDSSLC